MIMSILTRVAWMVAVGVVVFLVYRAGGFNTESIAKVGRIADTRGGNIIISVLLHRAVFRRCHGPRLPHARHDRAEDADGG